MNNWKEKFGDKFKKLGIIHSEYPTLEAEILTFIQEILSLKEKDLCEAIEGKFEHLYKVKKCWEKIEKDGNPNEQVKTQIHGFNQAFKIADSAFKDILTLIKK